MSEKTTTPPHLERKLGLLGLTATGICSMIGASIYIVPIMIQRNVPGIGPYVLPAFLMAAIPALLAAFSYASLSSAMPRAGGSYILRAVVCILIGVLWPVLPSGLAFGGDWGHLLCYHSLFRDIAAALDWAAMVVYLDMPWLRLALALLLLWGFVFINMRGLQFYERALIPLMLLMFVLGGIVIVAGFYFNQSDFEAALLAKEGRLVINQKEAIFSFSTFLSAAVLFASFIGFDSIAQAGGEAKSPERLLPIAIALAVIVVGVFISYLRQQSIMRFPGNL
ncbi:MAG: hypothetical protein R2822_00575 [Spirosomataceae bacterium]